MSEQGGTSIFMFNLAKHRIDKNSPDVSELALSGQNIILNPKLFPDYPSSAIEHSLESFLQYIYVEYPQWVKIIVNGREANLKNPYALMKFSHPNSFVGDKTDKFAV